MTRERNDSATGGPGEPGPQHVPEQDGPEQDGPEQGGEAACWLDRVCAACGQLADDSPPTRCPRCAATIPLP